MTTFLRAHDRLINADAIKAAVREKSDEGTPFTRIEFADYSFGIALTLDELQTRLEQAEQCGEVGHAGEAYRRQAVIIIDCRKGVEPEADEDGWMPIETLPDDETDFTVKWGDRPSQMHYWFRGYGCNAKGFGNTHWKRGDARQ